MTSVIFIFGPSCSGKSILSKALQKSLGRQWVYIDRDQYNEFTGDKEVENIVRTRESKMIVDAQIPWRESKDGEHYFLVLPPLATLLERNQVRENRRNRDEVMTSKAKQFVLDTHETLSKMDSAAFTEIFDSSISSVAEEVKAVKAHL